jgi:AraC-like DNA-binding protein
MFSPPADLQGWIQAGVVWRGSSDLPCTQFPAIVESLLVVRISGDIFTDANCTALLPKSSLILPATRSSSYSHVGTVHTVGLVLQPEVTSCLVQGGVENLINQHVDLADIFGDEFNGSFQKIIEADDDSKRMEIIFEYFRSRILTRENEFQRDRLNGVSRALRGDLIEACRIMGISLRQLQRRCIAGFGVTPKNFQTITRLKNTLRMALLPTPVGCSGSKVDLALDNGFFDQSHMARDLRRLASMSLSDLPRKSSIIETPLWPLTVGTRFT